MKTLNQMLTDTPTLLAFVEVPLSLQTDIDSTALKTAIIRRCGDVWPYYQKPLDFIAFGDMWFKTHDFLFKHADEIWKATYNPIENYNRTEETTAVESVDETRGNTDTHSGTDTITTSGNKSGSDTHSGTDTITTSGNKSGSDTHSGTDTVTTSGNKSGSDTHSGTDTITDSVTRETEIAGFDSSAYSDANKETEAGTHGTAHGHVITKAEQESGSEATAHGHVVTVAEQTSGSEATAHGHVVTVAEQESGSEATAHGHVITSAGTNSTDTEKTVESNIHGNIGVTTSQQMLESEIELANKFWLYDYIANAFETDNFITVYGSYFEGAQFEGV